LFPPSHFEHSACTSIEVQKSNAKTKLNSLKSNYNSQALQHKTNNYGKQAFDDQLKVCDFKPGAPYRWFSMDLLYV